MVFYLHWVANGGTSFGIDDHVEDEDVFSFDVTHQEGDFATLKVEVINPNVGLLSAGRKQWVWFSYSDGVALPVALFHGRLIGIPENLDERVVTLSFLGRPSDFVAQKEALAESLKVLPYYDRIWIDEDSQDDPDAVLEGYSARYHIGRVDKTVTISDLIVGEAGTVAFGESEVPFESVQISKSSPPIQKVHVEATVSWDQHAQGTVDFTRLIEKEFGSDFSISSYTWQGLMEDWPEYGDDIGGGWTVFNSSIRLVSDDLSDADFVEVTIDPTQATPDFTIEDWWATSIEGYQYWYDRAYEAWLANAVQEGTSTAKFYLGVLDPTFEALYQANRARKEILIFDVEADTQALLAEGEPVVQDLKISSDTIVDREPNGDLPIGSTGNNTYFGRDRGKQSIDHLLARVRAMILASARAINVSFDVFFEAVIPLSCRHDIVLTLDDLPGGEVGGKVVAYSFGLNGDSGEKYGHVTIACTIGKGGTVDPDGGTPTYVAEGHVIDHQFYAGQSIQPIAGEITYDDFVVDPDDDGIDFNNMTAENSLTGIFASALFSFSGPGVNNETVVIGARTYTLKAALTGADQVLIGAAAEITAQNLADAINREEDFEGIRFGTGTVAHSQVSAEAEDGIVRASARVGGIGGNSIAVSDTSAAGSWGTATLTGGHRGITVYFPPAAQEAALDVTVGDVSEAVDILKVAYTEIELSLKDVAGGPFETTINLVVSELKVPKTIDLEAA